MALAWSKTFPISVKFNEFSPDSGMLVFYLQGFFLFLFFHTCPTELVVVVVVVVRVVNDELLETSLFGNTDDPREGRTSCKTGWLSFLGLA